nr:hypothetical protein CFP56_66125 [Quercus suber]
MGMGEAAIDVVELVVVEALLVVDVVKGLLVVDVVNGLVLVDVVEVFWLLVEVALLVVVLVFLVVEVLFLVEVVVLTELVVLCTAHMRPPGQCPRGVQSLAWSYREKSPIGSPNSQSAEHGRCRLQRRGHVQSTPLTFWLASGFRGRRRRGVEKVLVRVLAGLHGLAGNGHSGATERTSLESKRGPSKIAGLPERRTFGKLMHTVLSCDLGMRA